ncbi:AlpA family phage regulatory protein [Caballeronia sp. ATUFL_M2_KS44]|uniref:helix-turn-helix transcriptional regulator n=1 Tax=Caballeronia sp. ATUFL_M2_KS44 TaxID=2921767 RepID=UPI002028C3E5|nr:AlpA family phage regulatory protein [Caballeronia sp. ATUFL_M2_KS44]
MAAIKQSAPKRVSPIRADHVDPALAERKEPPQIPPVGFTRWDVLKQIVPLSHESVRLREKAGRFPKRVQLGSARCVAWDNQQIHAWLRDPSGYRTPVTE